MVKLNPAGWGEDKLTEFLNVAEGNTRATFANKKIWVNRLIAINEVFDGAVNNLINPPDLLPAFLLPRSHSSYLAASRLGLSGQCAETYVVSRSCLENALYGHFLFVHPELSKVWLKRHDSLEDLKKCKDLFTYSKIKNCLVEKNKEVGETTDLLYQHTIDIGAHPNERSLTSNLEIIEQGERKQYWVKYLHSNGLELDVALKTVASVGLASLQIFQQVFTARFDLLGLSDKIQQMVGL